MFVFVFVVSQFVSHSSWRWLSSLRSSSFLSSSLRGMAAPSRATHRHRCRGLTPNSNCSFVGALLIIFVVTLAFCTHRGLAAHTGSHHDISEACSSSTDPGTITNDPAIEKCVPLTPPRIPPPPQPSGGRCVSSFIRFAFFGPTERPRMVCGTAAWKACQSNTLPSV